MSFCNESWKAGYDAWKLATPPEYDTEYDTEDDERGEQSFLEEQFLAFCEDEIEIQSQLEAA